MARAAMGAQLEIIRNAPPSSYPMVRFFNNNTSLLCGPVEFRHRPPHWQRGLFHALMQLVLKLTAAVIR